MEVRAKCVTSHFGLKTKPPSLFKTSAIPSRGPELKKRKNNFKTFLEQPFPTGIKRRLNHGSLEEGRMAMSGFQKRSKLSWAWKQPALGD